MPSIFDPEVRHLLRNRIAQVSTSSVAQWGRMNVHQMVRHCVIWDGWIQGVRNPTYKREWLGYIFGRLALRVMLKEGRPFDRNIPTLPFFQATAETSDLDADKERWLELLDAYGHFHNPRFIHDFFGRMSDEQIGTLAYKHSDHHLRQFGA